MRVAARTFGGVLVAVALGLAASRAHAAEPGVEVDPIHPAASPNSYLTLDGASVTPHLVLFTNASVGYAYGPTPTLRVPLFEGGADVATPVLDRMTLTLWTALGLFDVVQLGVGLPIVVGQTVEGFQDPRVYDAMPLSGGSGVGDLFFGVKARVYEIAGFAFAVALELDVPTGQPNAFRGELGAALTPRVIAEYRSTGLRVALGLGVRGRTVTGVLPDTRPLGSQGLLGLAVSLRAADRLWLAVEARGRLALDVNELDYASFVEVGGGPVFNLTDQIEIAAAGGFGLTQVYGSPQVRVSVDLRVHFGVVPPRGHRVPTDRRAPADPTPSPEAPP